MHIQALSQSKIYKGILVIIYIWPRTKETQLHKIQNWTLHINGQIKNNKIDLVDYL